MFGLEKLTGAHLEESKVRKILSTTLIVLLVGTMLSITPAVGADESGGAVGGGGLQLVDPSKTGANLTDGAGTGTDSGEHSSEIPGTDSGGSGGGFSQPLPWEQNWQDFFGDPPEGAWDKCKVSATWFKNSERWVTTPRTSDDCEGVGVLTSKSKEFPPGTSGRTSGNTFDVAEVDVSTLLNAVCSPEGSQLRARGVEYKWSWKLTSKSFRVPYTSIELGERKIYFPNYTEIPFSLRSRITAQNPNLASTGHINPMTSLLNVYSFGLDKELVIDFDPSTCIYDYVFAAEQECIVGVTADISLNKNAKGTVSPARSVITGGKVDRKTSFGQLVDRDLRDDNTFRTQQGNYSTYFEEEVLASCLNSRSEKEEIHAQVTDYGIYSGTIDFTKRALEYQKVVALNNNGERKTLYFPESTSRETINNLVATWSQATVGGMSGIINPVTAGITVSDEVREVNPVAWSYHCDINHGGATVVKFNNYSAANSAGYNYDATKCYNGINEVTFLECTPSNKVWTQTPEGVETKSNPSINIARDGAPIKVSWNPDGKTSETALTGGPIVFRNSQSKLLSISPTVHWADARSTITRTGTPWNANDITYANNGDNNFRLIAKNRTSEKNLFTGMKNGNTATYDGDIMRDFSPNQRTRSLEISADWSSDLGAPTVITPSVTYPVTLSGNFNTIDGIDISYEGGVTAHMTQKPGTISTEVTCVGAPLTVNVLKANSTPSE